MPTLKITDQIIKSVDRYSFYDLTDESLMATVNQLSNVTLNQSQDTVWYEGKNKIKLAGLDTNKGLEVDATNGFIDSATMALQTGQDVVVYDGIEKFIEADHLDEIFTTDGTTAITTYEAYSPNAGAEITYVYKINGSSIAGSTKYTQAATAGTNNFAYDPTTKTITLPTGVFERGDVVLAQYRYKATGTSVSSDTEHFSKSARVVIDLTTSDICTDEITHSQIIVPKAKIDGNFSITVGDSPAVHNIKVTSTPSVCFGASKDLFTYQLVNPIV